MSVSIDGSGSLIGIDQGLNIVGLTTLTGGIILDDSISHIGDTNTKIRFPAADTITAETGGTERLRITSGGDMGLGSNSPNFSTFGSNTGGLEISDVNNNNALLVQSGANEFFFANSSTANYIWGSDAVNLIIGTNNTERLRISSAGYLLINTSTSRIVEDHVGNGPQGKIQIEATNSDAIMSIISAGTADANRCGTINLGRHRNSTVGGTPTRVNDNDALGAVVFSGGDGTDMRCSGAKIHAEVDGTPAENSMPTALVFSTNPGGQTSLYQTEKVRITPAGDVGIGENSPADRLVVQKTNASGDVAVRIKNDTLTDGSASNPTTASLYLNTSTGDFNTFYMQARRNDNYTHFGYADPRASGHVPYMVLTNDRKTLIGGATSPYSEYNGTNSGWNGGHYINVGGSTQWGTLHIADWDDHTTKDSYGGTNVFLSRCKSETIGDHSGGALAANNPIARLLFNGSDGGAFRNAAWIECKVDGTPGSNNMPGLLSFATSSGSGAAPVERMRVTAGGVIQCGTSSVLKAEINNAVSGHQFISQCSDNNNGFEVYQQHGSNTTRNNFAVYANTGNSNAKNLQFAVRGDGVVSSPQQPAFQVHGFPSHRYMNTWQNVDLSSWNHVTQNGSHFNNGNGRFTAPVAGKYFFIYTAMYHNPSSNDFAALIMKNNSQITLSNNISGGGSSQGHQWNDCTVQAVVDMAANDFVTFRTVGSNSSTCYLYGNSGSNYNTASGFLIG